MDTAARLPHSEALRCDGQGISYAQLALQIELVSAALLGLGIQRCERVAVYLEKRIETVLALFGASMAGAAFVPVNPLLKTEQVAYQLRDCQVRILVTSAQRFQTLLPGLLQCPDMHTVIIVGESTGDAVAAQFQTVGWDVLAEMKSERVAHRCIDLDLAAILYTSGSTGKPKGVMLSHRNLVSGAHSVSQYLHNSAQDRVLCVLPLSFDYGLSQLTTMFLTGGTAVLLNYLMPVDILDAVRQERITGLAAIPPLWGQLTQLDWAGVTSLRYLTNSGGAMPGPVLARLRSAAPDTLIYLMYGLTEAFRSTFLDPQLVDVRPGSIGKAIPNNEVLVLRPDGSVCAPNEPGELVHRGALVALGYWNQPELTARRFRPVPVQSGATVLHEMAVWSGDTVRRDNDGYLYYVGRSDEQIKVSGFRISPTEVEEVLCRFEGITELAVIGVAHAVLGQALIAVVVQNDKFELTETALRRHCARFLPSYMVPAHFEIDVTALPRNANGKINRQALQSRFATFFQTQSTDVRMNGQPESRRP